MIERLHQLFLRTYLVSIDSRNIKKGSVFFALKGPSFNANHFALEALNMGAAFAVIDEEVNSSDNRLFRVDNVLTALQQLAAYHRKQFNIPVIAVTGSNGKTTTKELLNCVLSKKYKTIATIGNLNNHIGVPLTLLRIDKTVELAIIEMGANHQKEIELLCNIAEPTHGLITNVGKAHLEGFGGFEGVIKGKTEMYIFLKQNNGFLFCNADNTWLAPNCKEYKSVCFYGTSDKSDVEGTLLSDHDFLSLAWKNKTAQQTVLIHSQIPGRYNFENIMAAIAVGNHFEVDSQKIKDAIENYSSDNQRSQIIHKAGNTIMLDAYNANPTSMEVAIKNFETNFNPPKIVLLGDMFELGAEEDFEHKRIIDLINNCNFISVILVGQRFKRQQEFINALFFDNSLQACEWIKTQQFTGHNILIKGSRSSKMELVLDGI